MADSIWIILTGSLVAVACSLPGCFLILRNLSMVGDAISHAILPGIVISYLMTGTKDPFFMFIGAVVFGLLTTLLIEFFHNKAALQTDASIGVVFTFLFSVGVILISLYTQYLHLDQHTVLHGEMPYIPLNVWYYNETVNMGPIAVWIMGFTTFFVIILIILSYKELKITSFDPFLASSLGISTVIWHYLLMGMISVVSVASFKSVGAVLVLAFIVGPPATAFILTNKLTYMLILSVIIGISSSVTGYFIALALNSSISGSMAFSIGLHFLAFIILNNIKKYLVRKKALYLIL